MDMQRSREKERKRGEPNSLSGICEIIALDSFGGVAGKKPKWPLNHQTRHFPLTIVTIVT